MSKIAIAQKLRDIQKNEGLPDGQMAKRLGYSRQQYQTTKAGKISIGLIILRGACKAFPGLTGDAIIF